jgi:hypothetical protein
MVIIDLLLNLAALLMWVSWRGIRGGEAAGSAGTILGNLRPAGVRQGNRRHYLWMLGGLLLVRALVYRQVGPSLPWHPVWSLGPATVAFRSDYSLRMFGFSALDFLTMLLFWYTGIAGILAVNRPPGDRDGLTRALRAQSGFLGGLPGGVLLVMVCVMAGLLWAGVGWLAAGQGMVPPLRSGQHLLQQSVLVVVGQLCVLRWWFAAILLLHLLNLYVYVGNHVFWDFIQNTGSHLCRPFSFFRIGQADLSPIPTVLVCWTIPTMAAAGMPWLKPWLPGLPAWMEFGILPAIFRVLPL